MDDSVSERTQTRESTDWELAFHRFENVITTGSEALIVKAIIKLSQLSNHAPEIILIRTVPILVKLVDSCTTSRQVVLKAALYGLKCISRQGDGRLATVIGQSGAIKHILCLLPHSQVSFQKVLLKCLQNIVAFDGPNRVNVVRIGGLKVILDMLNSCPDSLRLLLFDILSALSLLREVRRSILNLGGVHLLVESAKIGSMASRTRAAQAIGLLGLHERARRLLVNAGVIEVLVKLLQAGDTPTKIVAGNALGVIASHINYVRPVAQHGVVPLYAELLQGDEPLAKEIADDVLCILAVIDSNAISIVEHLVTIMRGNNNESKGVAATIMWDLSAYEHALPVFQDSGAISLLLDVLRTSDDTYVKENVCAAISQLSFNEGGRAAIASLGGIGVLISALEEESTALRYHAAQSLVFFYVDPIFRNQMAGALDRPLFMTMREMMIAEGQVAEVEEMMPDELTWNPDLV